MKNITSFLFVIAIAIMLAPGCEKDEDDNNEAVYDGLSNDIQNIVPADILQEIIDLGMPVHRGNTPPDFENTYLATPMILLKTTVPGDVDLGTQFVDLNMKFYEQNNTALTVKIDYDGGGETGVGKGGFIVGENNKFTVFAKVDVEIMGYHADMVEIYSAKVVTGGLDDFYFANFMIDDKGNPGGVFIPNGTGRILYDSDGFSEIIESSSSDLPVVATLNVTNITGNSATCGGNITDDGGSSVIARGVCWSTSQNPTISNNHTNDGNGTGQFTSSIAGLSQGINYFVRAYATNSKGTSYGNEVSFTPIQGQSMEYLIVSAYDGVYKVDKYGNSSYFSSGCYDIEIFDNYIYTLTSDYVKKYSINGNLIASIPIASQVDYKIAFVVIPNQGFAFLDNQYDKVYFTDFNGNYITEVSMPNANSASLQNVKGIVVNDKLIVSENGNNGIISIDLNNYSTGIFKDFSNLQGWLGAVGYSNGTYYLCQATKIHSFTNNSNPSLITTVPNGNLTGISIDGAIAYASINFENRVIKLDLNTGTYSNFITGINKPDDIEIYWGSN
ncbi:MAG: hypothetical protein K9H16_00860 [Bacteroidales bacterium]|nr:hypothetical protein [Bacteroidales bacterium]